jgi:hypothetical protein
MCVLVSLWVYIMCMWGAHRAQKRVLDSHRSRRLWGTQHGCWTLTSGPLKSGKCLVMEASLQLSPFLYDHLEDMNVLYTWITCQGHNAAISPVSTTHLPVPKETTSIHVPIWEVQCTSKYCQLCLRIMASNQRPLRQTLASPLELFGYKPLSLRCLPIYSHHFHGKICLH